MNPVGGDLFVRDYNCHGGHTHGSVNDLKEEEKQ